MLYAKVLQICAAQNRMDPVYPKSRFLKNKAEVQLHLGLFILNRGYFAMEKREQLYEGKAKKVFKTDDENLYLVQYKDDATAFNGLKKGTIQGKGVINNKVTNFLMQMLEAKGIPTHYVQQLSDRETLVKKVEIIPVEVVVRNIAAGGLAKRMGLPEGTPMASTVLEYSYKNDQLGDPMINETHVYAMGLDTPER